MGHERAEDSVPRKLQKQENPRKTGFPVLRPPWGLQEILMILVLVYLFGFLLSLFGARLVDRVLLFFPAVRSLELASFFLTGVLQSLLLGGLVLGFVRGKHRASLAYLGLGLFSWKDLVVGLVGGLAVFSLVILAMALIIFLLPHHPQPQPFAEVILQARRWQELVLPLILGGIFAPLGEELYFRGFIYPVFRSRFGPFPAVCITSLFFAALHCDLARFLPLALGGAGLALICEKTGSLFPALAAHSTWNLAMTFLVVLGRQAL